MTVPEITAQIIDAATKHAASERQRIPTFACATPEMTEAVERQFLACYLSGVMQTTNFLAGNDGVEGCHAQNMMAACRAAGVQLGFEERKPDNG